jgi:hypothetical protein
MHVGLLALFCRRFRDSRATGGSTHLACGEPTPSSCRVLRRQRSWPAATGWRVEWRECW